MKMKKSASKPVELRNVPSRPIVNTDTGEKLSDSRLVRRTVKAIDEYVQEHGRLPVGLDGKFIQWLRETDAACQAGADVVTVKQTTVSRTFDDYSILEGVDK